MTLFCFPPFSPFYDSVNAGAWCFTCALVVAAFFFLVNIVDPYYLRTPNIFCTPWAYNGVPPLWSPPSQAGSKISGSVFASDCGGCLTPLCAHSFPRRTPITLSLGSSMSGITHPLFKGSFSPFFYGLGFYPLLGFCVVLQCVVLSAVFL